jgi:TRAP-type C4-dicarboxylate transport system substrate-binding protein
LCAAAAPARAQTTLRFATVAPDGTMWARVLRDWGQDVEKESSGAVRIKLYFGGIAGDELEVGERIHRGQLDGMISAGTFCQKVAPSSRVLKVVGLFQDRDEAAHVMSRLKPTFDKEALANGFVNVADSGLGSIIVFSRKSLATMADLRSAPLWTGRQDDLMLTQLTALGLHAVPERMDQAATAYADGRIDGYLTVPSVALAWQWSTQVRYYTDLRLSFLFGCLVVSNASFDGLPMEAQAAVRAAAARALARLDQLGRKQDDALVNSLFEKQGLKQVRVDERFRTEFFEAARTARERLSDELVPAALVRNVLAILADYRAQYRQ